MDRKETKKAGRGLDVGALQELVRKATKTGNVERPKWRTKLQNTCVGVKKY